MEEEETWGFDKKMRPIDIDNGATEIPTEGGESISAEFCRGAGQLFPSLHPLVQLIATALRNQLRRRADHVAPCGPGSC